MRSLIWRRKAAAQLAEILGYVAERDRTAADRLAALVDSSAATILTLPHAGRPGRVARTREWVVHPNYILIYRDSRSSITILRILHARQLYP